MAPGSAPKSAAEVDGGNLARALCCGRIAALGRVGGLSFATLHPDILGVNFIWKPGAEVTNGAHRGFR